MASLYLLLQSLAASIQRRATVSFSDYTIRTTSHRSSCLEKLSLGSTFLMLKHFLTVSVHFSAPRYHRPSRVRRRAEALPPRVADAAAVALLEVDLAVLGVAVGRTSQRSRPLAASQFAARKSRKSQLPFEVIGLFRFLFLATHSRCY